MAAVAFEFLSSQEVRVIGECLAAAVDGPFFPDFEFHALFGLERDELRRVWERWPNTDADEIVVIGVNNSLLNLRCYPHGREDALGDYVSVPPACLDALLDRWQVVFRTDGEL